MSVKQPLQVHNNILFSLMVVIGIHNGRYIENNLNRGTFIGEIIEDMNIVKN